ncbi:MAG TPA: glycosyltransferase family 39 protein [Kofleriaceae bacterium]|nr:glycosyltransferase family 39 protein [Kofleriaceae bacterium]
MSERRRSLVAVAAAAAAIAALLAARAALVTGDPLDRLARAPEGDRVAHTGSWHFPRGGPYVLGFESPGGEASLEIDGRPVARGAGLKSGRVVYQPGAHAVRFVAPPGARLLWHPPGRRGPLEYVPPSSLAPEPPEQAAFGSGAGASRGDGVIAGLIGLVAFGLCLYLARARLRQVDRRTAALAAGVFALALAVRLVDLGGAGQTWDEDVNWSAGRNYVSNWLALDVRPSSWQWNLEHPPVMKVIAGVGAQLADGYGPARALSALMLAIACALMVPIGRRLFSLPVGVIGGAAAALTPHLVAHGKIVGHEAPTVLLWTLALLLALGAHDRLGDLAPDRARRRLAIRLAVIGAVLGLAVFSRFVNLLLAPLLGAVLLIQAPPATRGRTAALGAAILPLVALAVGFAVWPRLWETPIAHLQESWAVLKKPHSPEPFLGEVTNQPGRHYFLVYLAATAPLGVLLGAAAWLGRAVHRRERGSLLLALWLAAPLLVLFSPVRQDGVRYIMPSVAALSLAAAAGLDWLVALAGRALSPGRRARATAAAGAALVLYLGVACARIHPYYLDYYGEQVGGPAGAAARGWFEVAWWGEGIAEAIDHVNRNAAPGARVHKGCVEPSHLTWLRGDLWEREARHPAAADWMIVYQPSWRRCPVPDGMVLSYEVRAQGAPLARVYRRAGTSSDTLNGR